jgi:hypothetical protein
MGLALFDGCNYVLRRESPETQREFVQHGQGKVTTGWEMSVTVLSRVMRHASSAPLAWMLPGDRRGKVVPDGHETASSHGDHCHGSS